MDFTFQDRVSTYPNRYKVTKADGASEFVTLERADEPTVVGTALNANTFNSAFGEIEAKIGGGGGGGSVARNLLDNSNFRSPVNQRGQTSYVVTGAHTIDRWMSNGAVEIVDGGIRVSSGVFRQRIENLDVNKTYTLAAEDILGNVYVFVGVPQNGAFNDGADFELCVRTGVDNVVVGLKSGLTYKWAALYEGAYTAENLPEYQPKGYATELLECQRYFLSLDSGITYPATRARDATIDFLIPTPTKMRLDSPTIVGNFSAVDAGIPMLIGDFSVAGSGYNAITIRATDSSGYNVDSTDNIALKGSSGAGLSADL